MNEQLIARIRFAEQLSAVYFDSLEQLRSRGRATVLGGVAYDKDALDVAITGAAATADSLIETTREVVELAEADAITGVPTELQVMPPALDELELGRIRFNEAVEARAALAGLKSAMPEVDWRVEDLEEVNLFAAKRRVALIAFGVLCVAATVLAFISPMTAFVVGMLAVFVFGKAVLTALMWR